MRNVKLAIAILFLAGCQVEPGAKNPIDTTVSSPGSVPAVQTTPEGSPQGAQAPNEPLTVTYYALAVTMNPTGLTGAITVTGYCAQYQNNTYCWDDGIKTQTIQEGQSFEHFNYSFWGLTLAGNGVSAGACYGDCQSDSILLPTTMTSNLQMEAVHAQATPNQVITEGVASTGTCTVANEILSCGNFTVDLSQVGQ